MAYSRNNSHDNLKNGGPVRSLHTTAPPPWPLIDVPLRGTAHALDPPTFAAGAEHMSAQQALEKVISNPNPPKRRMSKLRLFTSGLPLLRRQNTGDASAGAGDTSDTTSPTATAALAAHVEIEEGSAVEHPDDQAVEAYLLRNARKCVDHDDFVHQLLTSFSGEKFSSIISRIAKRLPSPADFDPETSDAHVSDSTSLLPTTLRAAVRLFPQVKLITNEFQEFSVAIDIEGVLYNRKPLPDTGIDVIFVVDNG